MAKGRTAHGDEMRARLIAELRSRPQRPPTYRELAVALGIKPYAVRQHVLALEADGILTRDRSTSRGLRLVQP